MPNLLARLEALPRSSLMYCEMFMPLSLDIPKPIVKRFINIPVYSLLDMDKHRKVRLAQLIKTKFDGDRAAFQQATSLTKGRVSQLLDPDEPFGERAAQSLVNKLNLSARWFEGQSTPEPGPDELTGHVSSVVLRFAFRHGIIQGGDNGFIDCIAPSDQDPEPVAYASTMRDEQAYAVKVRGNSMEPAIMQGWDVIASPNRPAQPPDLCVVYFADDRKALKRFLWQRDGLVCLESLHVDHKKMTEKASDIVRMDKVIAIVPN